MKKGYMKALPKGWVRGLWVASVVGCVSAGFGAESLSARTVRKGAASLKAPTVEECIAWVNGELKAALPRYISLKKYYGRCRRNPAEMIKLRKHLIEAGITRRPVLRVPL